MNSEVRATRLRSFVLPFLGVVVTSVLVGLLVHGIGGGHNLAESMTVLPFGG